MHIGHIEDGSSLEWVEYWGIAAVAVVWQCGRNVLIVRQPARTSLVDDEPSHKRRPAT
jgi:hypothetical protein